MGVKFLVADPMIAAAFEVWAVAFQANKPLNPIAAAMRVITKSFRISPPLHSPTPRNYEIITLPAAPDHNSLILCEFLWHPSRNGEKYPMLRRCDGSFCLRGMNAAIMRVSDADPLAAVTAVEEIVASKIDELLPSAKDVMGKIALAEAEDAEKQAKLHAEADAEKKALIDHLRQPSGVSDEEGIRRAMKIIERATKNLLTEVQVYRFPNQLCTDKGRAINQQEPGWEKTLTGVPKEIYDLWHKYFRPRGYKLKVQIVDFPGGVPGDIGMTLSWA
jgi:hypothetical protein